MENEVESLEIENEVLANAVGSTLEDSDNMQEIGNVEIESEVNDSSRMQLQSWRE